MADSSILQPFILSWEGGYVNDPDDKGGETMRGVTLGTFRQIFGNDKTVQDLKSMTTKQWHTVFKKYYWDRWQADHIISQSVANLVVDWVWASGKYGITKVQELLGVKVDGIVGEKTLSAINALDSRVTFKNLWQAREVYFRKCPTFWKYGKGWLNRLDGIKFCYLKLNEYKTIDRQRLCHYILFNDKFPHNAREEWV